MREQIISTQKIKAYQVINLILWLTLLVLLVLLIADDFVEGKTSFFRFYWLVYWGVSFYILFIKRTMRLKSISYDNENLYIVEKGQEIVIPFTEVHYIKLRTVVGLHSIHLYRDLGYGKVFYFKSSLWYPFNFKKVDDQVYRLQKKIDLAKARYQPANYNALGS